MGHLPRVHHGYRLLRAACALGIIDTFWNLKEPRARVTNKTSDAAVLPQQTVTADADGYMWEVLGMLEKCVRIKEGFE